MPAEGEHKNVTNDANLEMARSEVTVGEAVVETQPHRRPVAAEPMAQGMTGYAVSGNDGATPTIGTPSSSDPEKISVFRN